MSPLSNLRQLASWFIQAKVPPKLMTLVVVRLDNQQVLLGRKKRGIGEGFYNGFGGKCEANESILQAAHRELREEAGIAASDLRWRGLLRFKMGDNPQPWEVHVFDASQIVGKPTESDEMEPCVFPINALPYDKMWQDDPVWYPLLFNGSSFFGIFEFDNGITLLQHRIHSFAAERSPVQVPAYVEQQLQEVLEHKMWEGIVIGEEPGAVEISGCS